MPSEMIAQEKAGGRGFGGTSRQHGRDMQDEGLSAPRWRALGGSRIGAAHARADRPNRDAVGWWPEAGRGPEAVLAVAGGLDGAKSFRGDRGAQLAVAAALESVVAVLEGSSEPAVVRREAQERLPVSLVRAWRERVTQDLAREPLSEAELDALSRAEGGVARQLVAGQPLLVYGATLLAAAITPTFSLFVRIGGGEALTVSDTGQVTRPLAIGPRADGAASLAAPQADKELRVVFQTLSGAPPALVLLTSDGYARSFPTETAFQQMPTDLHAMIQMQGLSVVEESLEDWLTQASQEGAGDDVTLGLLARTDFGAGRLNPAPVRAAVPGPERIPPPVPAVAPQEDAPGAEPNRPLLSGGMSWRQGGRTVATGEAGIPRPSASGTPRRHHSSRRAAKRRQQQLRLAWAALALLLLVIVVGGIAFLIRAHAHHRRPAPAARAVKPASSAPAPPQPASRR